MMQILDQMVVQLLGDAKSYEGMATGAIANTQKLEKSIQASASKIQGIADSITSFGQQAQGILGMLAGSLGIGGISQAIQSAIDRAGQAEQIDISFKVLIGDATRAQRAIKDLKQFAAETPFEQPEILAAAKQMLGFGTQAEDIVPTMKTLGDVASGLGVPLGQLSYLFGTLKAQGRAFTIDIRQFAMRGIPIYLELAKVLGMVGMDAKQLGQDITEKLNKKIEKGEINFDIVEKAFKNMTKEGGAFGGMMKEQSASFLGLISTLKDNLGMMLEDIGRQIIAGLDLKSIIQEVGAVAGAFATWFKEMDPNTKKMIMSFVGVAAGLGVLIAAVLAVKAALLAIGAIVATVGAPFLVIAGAVAVALGLWVHEMGGIGPALDAAKEKAAEFWAWLLPIRTALGNLFSAIGEQAKTAWDAVKAAAVAAWESIKSNFNINWEEIRSRIVEGLLFAEFSVRNFAMVWDAAWKGIKYSAIAALNFLLAHAGEIIVGITIGPLVVLWQAFKLLWQKVVELTKQSLATIANNVAELAKNFPKLLTGEMKFSDIWKGFNANIGFTPGGLVIKPLKHLEEEWRKEWEESSNKVRGSFEDFKAARMKEAVAAGTLPETIPEKAKKQAESIAKSHKAAAKEIQKFDQVLRGSTESLARIIDYRQRLQKTGAPVANASAAASAGPSAMNVNINDKTAGSSSAMIAEVKQSNKQTVDTVGSMTEIHKQQLEHLKTISSNIALLPTNLCSCLCECIGKGKDIKTAVETTKQLSPFGTHHSAAEVRQMALLSMEEINSSIMGQQPPTIPPWLDVPTIPGEADSDSVLSELKAIHQTIRDRLPANRVTLTEAGFTV